MNRILLVEDDAEIVKNLTKFLQEEGFCVKAISGQKEALEYIEQREQEIDLILLDVNLPDGNGFDFAREAIPKDGTPFIFLTAHNLEEEIIKGLRLGADDYIVKPFPIKVAMEKIQVVLRRCCRGRG